MYSSNQTLRTAAKKVFAKEVDASAFLNPRRRPDLLVLKDASVSLVGSEEFDHSSNLATMREVLLLELKRGRSTIGRDDVNQAEGYVQDLQLAGIDGPPFFRAFVVGHEQHERVEPVRVLGDPPSARIQVTTYSQLVRTAQRRLFSLREELSERYDEAETDDLLLRAIAADGQLELDVTRLQSSSEDEDSDSVH